MAREQNIPLFLWVTAAILAHISWGGGADQVSGVLQDRTEVRNFAASVQRHLRDKFTTQITLFEDPGLKSDPAAPPPPSSVQPAEDNPETSSPSDKRSKLDNPDAPRRTDKSKEDRAKAAKPPKKKKKKKPEPPKKKEEKSAEKAKVPKPTAVPKAAKPKRVAVEQHVEDPNQKNENAEFIGDKANRVDKQTVARITSTDQNSAEPSPGSQHLGPTNEPGNAHVTDLAQSDDSPGELNRAPSEDKLAAKQVESTSKPAGVPEVAGRAKSGPEKSQSSLAAQLARQSSRLQQASPVLQSSESGSWTVAPERNAQAARSARRAQKYRAARGKGNPAKAIDAFGLGAAGVTERGVHLNLTPGTALAAIGKDKLEREIQADGERRRSKHRGSWRSVGIERWRPALENYTPTVALGNKTQLNTAHKPFAGYLNRIHNRLHPIFAVNYLGYLDSLPPSAGLQRDIPQMKTNLEIVLNQQSGAIVKMGVTRSSGVTVFDISVLESVQRASPFGPPPASIVSPDGNVYLHWEFHRNPIYACSTYFARPYIITAPQNTAPPNGAPRPAPFGPKEGQGTPAKRGALPAPHRHRVASAHGASPLPPFAASGD